MWQETAYTLPLAIAAVVTGVLVVVAYRNRETNGSWPLIAGLLGVLLYTVGDGVKITATPLELKLFAQTISYVGTFLVTGAVFLFAAEYTGRDQWLRPRRVAAIFGFHTVTFLLLITNRAHGLMRESVELIDQYGFVQLHVQWGTWDYIHTVYSYLLLVAGAWLLLVELRRSKHVQAYRGQTLTILVSMAVPWSLSIANVTGLTPVDLTALGFTVTGVMMTLAVYRYQILGIAPIARSTVIDNINEGYIVLDTTATVVDINAPAAQLVGVAVDDSIGRQFRELLPDHQRLLEPVPESGNVRRQVEISVEGQARVFNTEVSAIRDRRGQRTGRVILFRDVTGQEQRKRQLRRKTEALESKTAQLQAQNQRLEEFAGIVSHDLRNPLTVISGRTELARADPRPEHFDAINANVERMSAIVDDVLTMVRQEQGEVDLESVALDEIARRAWDTVETHSASLDLRVGRAISCDESRLQQLLENLFRNSIDHGLPDPSSGSTMEELTVTVGECEGGFYVADDGPGIPPEERERVLEKGFTTAESGTGLGLAIVRTITDAHGWSVAVTESADGGARFEITGVASAQVPEVPSSRDEAT